MTKKTTMTSADVLRVLGDKLFKTPAHAMLAEVSNGTGMTKARSADALVVSLWPSRGIWFGGIEVKVSRSDWKRELEQPAKSHAVQRFCSYWWIATTAGVIQPGELPETWGHIEVSESSARVLREAPKLTPDPLAPEFVAAVLRNHHESKQQRINARVFSEVQKVREECSGERVRQLERDLDMERMERRAADKRLQELRESLKPFRESTGVDPESWRATEQFKKASAAAQSLEGFDLARMADTLEHAAKQLREARDVIGEQKRGEGRAA